MRIRIKDSTFLYADGGGGGVNNPKNPSNIFKKVWIRIFYADPDSGDLL